MAASADTRHLRHSVLPRRLSRQLRRCCDRRALPAPITAPRRQATRLHPRHRQGTIRQRRRLSSTLLHHLATRLLVPITALLLPICMELARLLRRILPLPPRGLRHLQKLTRLRAQASPRALGRSNLPPAPATRPHRRHFLLERLGRELLETNIHLIPPLTIDFIL